MQWWRSISGAASSAWNAIVGIPGDVSGPLYSAWKYIKQTAQGVEYIFTHPVEDVINAAAGLAAILTGNTTALRNATMRLEGFVNQTMIQPNLAWIKRQLAMLRALIASDIAQLRRWVTIELAGLRRRVLHLIAVERKHRIQDFKRSEAYTRRHVRWALQVVQREAASGYAMSTPARVTVIQRILDLVVARNPLLRDLASRIASAVLTLIEIDDPLLRIALGFVVNKLIDSLGIDRVIGDLLRSLIDPLLGEKQPSNLHDVVMQIGQRLDALESQWATFMSDGGPEILQAGEEWQALSSLGVDAALLAFFGLAVTEPHAWARDVSSALSPIVGAAIDGVTAILG